MNTLRKVYLLSLLTVSFVLSVSYTQGQKEYVNEITTTKAQQSFSAGEDAAICNDSDFLTQGTTSFNGIFMWSSSGDGVFENTQNLNSVYTPGEHDINSGKVSLYLVLFPMGGGGNEIIYDEMVLHLGNCTINNQF